MIEFILKKDNKYNSLCQIKKDDVILYLTEKDLPILLEDMYEKRRDIFESLPSLDIAQSTINELKDTIDDLTQEKEELKENISELQDILDEEGIEY